MKGSIMVESDSSRYGKRNRGCELGRGRIGMGLQRVWKDIMKLWGMEIVGLGNYL